MSMSNYERKKKEKEEARNYKSNFGRGKGGKGIGRPAKPPSPPPKVKRQREPDSPETKRKQEAKRRANGVGTRSEGAWKALQNQKKNVKGDVTLAYKAARAVSSSVSKEEAARTAKKYGDVATVVERVRAHHGIAAPEPRKKKSKK